MKDDDIELDPKDYYNNLKITISIAILDTDFEMFIEELEELLDRYAMTRMDTDPPSPDYLLKVQ